MILRSVPVVLAKVDSLLLAGFFVVPLLREAGWINPRVNGGSEAQAVKGGIGHVERTRREFQYG